MEDINICDCCKDIWNRENLIKFDFTNNHKLFICHDCLKEMTNGDMIKAMFPNIESIDAPLLKVYVMVYTKDHKCMRFDADWWDAPYEKGE